MDCLRWIDGREGGGVHSLVPRSGAAATTTYSKTTISAFRTGRASGRARGVKSTSHNGIRGARRAMPAIYFLTLAI
jgi:hypothetical protein